MRLHVDRPCRVARVRGRWQWRCGCTPDAWGYTGSASSWALAYGQADRHVRIEHADLAPELVLAARSAGVLIDLDARRSAQATRAAAAVETKRAATATRAAGVA